jgi:hypothetical protein
LTHEELTLLSVHMWREETLREDINIRLMKMMSEEADKKFEFNMKMSELRRKLDKIDSKLGGIKQ